MDSTIHDGSRDGPSCFRIRLAASNPSRSGDRLGFCDAERMPGVRFHWGPGLTREGGKGASALWFLDPILQVGFLVALWANGRRGLRRRRWGSREPAPAVYVLPSWAVGMAYELSLSSGDGGFGGLHPTTAVSFLLGQGFYLPLAAFACLSIRRFRLMFTEVFIAGAAVSVLPLFGLRDAPGMATPLPQRALAVGAGFQEVRPRARGRAWAGAWDCGLGDVRLVGRARGAPRPLGRVVYPA